MKTIIVKIERGKQSKHDEFLIMAQLIIIKLYFRSNAKGLQSPDTFTWLLHAVV